MLNESEVGCQFGYCSRKFQAVLLAMCSKLSKWACEQHMLSHLLNKWHTKSIFFHLHWFSMILQFFFFWKDVWSAPGSANRSSVGHLVYSSLPVRVAERCWRWKGVNRNFYSITSFHFAFVQKFQAINTLTNSNCRRKCQWSDSEWTNERKPTRK